MTAYLLRVDKGTGENQGGPGGTSLLEHANSFRVGKSVETSYASSNGVVDVILRPAKSFGPRMVWRETPLLLLRLREIYSSWVLPSQNIRKPYDAAAKRRRGAKSLGLVEDATCSFGSPLATDRFVYQNRAGVATCHALSGWKKRGSKIGSGSAGHPSARSR